MKITELEKLLREFSDVNADVCVSIDGKVYDIIGEDPEIVGFGYYICLQAVKGEDFNKNYPWTKTLLKDLGYESGQSN